MQDTGAHLKNRKKARFRKLLCWLAVDLAVAALILALLLYRPARYHPLPATSFKEGQVSLYLTHELSPKFYDGAQQDKPFDLVVTEKGINDIIARGDWPKESEGVMLYAPAALFVPGRAVLMGTADLRGVQFVVSIELAPRVDEQGLLSLQVTKVKVGAMNITPLAKMMAKKMYAQRLAEMPVDTEALQTKIAASLLTDEPFSPVWDAGDRKVRLEKVTLENERMVLSFVPAS